MAQLMGEDNTELFIIQFGIIINKETPSWIMISVYELIRTTSKGLNLNLKEWIRALFLGILLLDNNFHGPREMGQILSLKRSWPIIEKHFLESIPN